MAGELFEAIMRLKAIEAEGGKVPAGVWLVLQEAAERAIAERDRLHGVAQDPEDGPA